MPDANDATKLIFVLGLRRKPDSSGTPALAVAAANLLLSAALLGYMGYRYCKSKGSSRAITWRLVGDVVTCALNITISVGLVTGSKGLSEAAATAGGEDQTGNKAQRVLEAVMAILIWTKSFYFTSHADAIAPLVRTIESIVLEIRYFVLTMAIVIFAFANSFYMLGKNQVQFDGIAAGAEPEYATVAGSLRYMYLICLGELSADAGYFALGKNPTQEPALTFLFLLATFTIIIHMMNMLIAIMGQTQGANTAIAEQTRLRTRLGFILENYYLQPLAEAGVKAETVYLICAFPNEGDDAEVEILKDLQQDVSSMRFNTNLELESILSEVQKVKSKIGSLESSVAPS